jgi:ligand-binding sensor domain-containing protein
MRVVLAWRALITVAVTSLVAMVAAPRALAGWKTFTTADGLVNNSVYGIVEDDEETLWFATNAGVSHYDGVTWRTYTTADNLASNHVISAFKAHDGSLWFGTSDNGVTEIANGVLRTYPAGLDLIASNVPSISEDRSGRIWLATTDGGAWWFDGTRWGKQDGLPTDNVQCVLEDHAGNLWIGTHDAGLYQCAGGVCTGIDRSKVGVDVRAIAEDSRHGLWFATAAGVSSRDSLGAWTTYTATNGLAGNNVLCVTADRAGPMWFGSVGGASRFDGHSWRRYNETEGYFSRGNVNSITQDRSGNLWLGTNAGAARFDGSELTTFPDVPILGTAVALGISQDRQGDLWFGTEVNGAFQYDGATWKQWFPNTTLPFPISDHAGNHWFPLYGTGLVRVDSLGDSTTFTIADGLVSNKPRFPIEDRDHNVWVAHTGGVSRYDGSTWTAYTTGTTGGGLAGSDFFGALQDRTGSLWFASNTDGASRLDSLGNWRTFTTIDGLGSVGVLSMLQDAARYFWFTTNGSGIDRFAGEPTPGGVQHFTTADGLRNDDVLGEVQTRDGDLWFTLDHGGGVTRWDGSSWRGIGVDDGLPSGSCHLILEDRSGDLWITTNRGIARYTRDYNPPRTVITQRPPAVSGSRSQSAFFAALAEAGRIEFSYRLDGGAWSGWSPLNGWSAQDLTDGIHALEVRARDYWLNLDPTPETAAFEVDATPPLPAITAPAFGAAVRGTAEIRGTASDARFQSYDVRVRPSSATSWDPPAATILGQSSSPVVDGGLAPWNTTSFPDGLYDVRVSVRDSLGLVGVTQASVVVDNHAPFADQTTPAKVTAISGGDVFTTNAEVHLYFPPHSFREDAVVVVTPADPELVRAPGGAARVDPGYEITWSGGPLRKQARLTLSYAGSSPIPPGTLALYYASDHASWERLGGTVDVGKHVIELGIDRPGSYALFADQGGTLGPRSVSGLSFTPRVFSPAGRYADREVGISFTLGRPASVTVRVYNRAGRLVREVVSGASFSAGSNLVRWDGADRSGRIVPDGIYLVSVEAFGDVDKLPLAVVR